MQSRGHDLKNHAFDASPRAGLVARAGRASGARRFAGFTLLEIIVAVGAIAVISVGVASILNAVGKTVTGGRRTSNLTQYSALIESQLRADFEAMTRDGFLVIRNQNVDANFDGVIDANDVVALSENDTRARVRRADEIMFFVRGGTETKDRLEPQSTTRRAYVSQRVPVVPGLSASSNVARIYYGHGRRSRPGAGTGSFQYGPTQVGTVDGDANARLGADFADNPNRFASDWTILRHVLVLSPQSATARSYTSSPVFGIDPATPAGVQRLADSDSQVALQPAAASIFRAINRVIPEDTPQNDLFRTVNGPVTGANNLNRPQIGTGLIDVASTSLEEIRSIVTTFPGFPGAIQQASDLQAWVPSIQALYPNISGNYPGLGDNALDRQHAWMRDAFPTQSLSQGLCYQAEPDAQVPPYSRMRYEAEPKDLVPVLALPAGDDDAERDRAALRADQLMLTASNFIPRCSEFIVEWSFGQIDDQGEMIWHGLWRRADLNGNGVVQPNEWVTRPYPLDRAGNVRYARRPVVINSVVGPLDLSDPAIAIPTDIPNITNVPTRLIHGFDDVEDPATERLALDSFFGYSDPTLPPNMSVVTSGASDSNGDGDHFNDIGDLIPREDVGKWPWPKLIRLTVTLSDPQDPTIESTFQYTFTTPKD